MFAQNENSDEKKRLNFEGNKNKFEIDDTIINENNNSISFRNKCFFRKSQQPSIWQRGYGHTHSQNAITRSIH